MRTCLRWLTPLPRHSEAVGDVTIALSLRAKVSHTNQSGECENPMGLALAPSVVRVRSSVVVVSFVPVAGSHLSELIMCDKTGMAEGGKEGRKKAASNRLANIIRDNDDICPPLSILPAPASLLASPYNCDLCRNSGQIHF